MWWHLRQPHQVLMPTATPTNDSLVNFCNTLFPNTGTVGYAALLRGATLPVNQAVTANATTDLFTLSSGTIALPAGARVRFAGTPPSPLLTVQDYYVIPVSSTTFKVANTLTDALASTAIDLTSTGTSVTVNEQLLTIADPVSVLVGNELPAANGYTRQPIANIGSATMVGVNADKADVTANWTASGGSLVFRHEAILVGSAATATPGSLTGVTACLLSTEASPLTIVSGQSGSVVIKLRQKP
jgi:hypothetical protein